MVERQPERGFTLMEVMAAVVILTFGVTSLLGLMTLGVSTRRSAEQVNRAVFLIDQIVQEVRENVFAERPASDDVDPDDQAAKDLLLAPPPPMQVDRVADMPGMSYRVEFTVDPQDPDVVLARIDVRWRQQGEAMAETFHRLLVRNEPFSKRVSRLRRQSK